MAQLINLILFNWFMNIYSGGMSNFLFYCALPAMAKPKQGEPSRVLVRFYGQIHGEGALEALLTSRSSSRCYQSVSWDLNYMESFPVGDWKNLFRYARVCWLTCIRQSWDVFWLTVFLLSQFQARPLKTKELNDPEISSIIAEKMAQIHCLDVPISKEPTWLWDMMNRWMSNMKVTLAAQPTKPIGNNDFIEYQFIIFQRDCSSAMRFILNWKLDSEMDWLKNYLIQLHSPVVFCHNVFGWIFHYFLNSFINFILLFVLGFTRG